MNFADETHAQVLLKIINFHLVIIIIKKKSNIKSLNFLDGFYDDKTWIIIYRWDIIEWFKCCAVHLYY